MVQMLPLSTCKEGQGAVFCHLCYSYPINVKRNHNIYICMRFCKFLYMLLGGGGGERIVNFKFERIWTAVLKLLMFLLTIV